MNTRLQQFLDLENLTPARLADIIGVQRSGLSHILSGRNKPSFDFIRRILIKYPRINSEWLITGKGKPYKDFEQTPPSTLVSGPSENFAQGQNQTLNQNSENSYFRQDEVQGFANFEQEDLFYSEIPILQNNEIQTQNTDNKHNNTQNGTQQPNENCTNGSNIDNDRQKKRVKRVIIFYSDGSFEELFPRIR